MNNPIRDYLYLDIDRVRSIYAQASGGLTESIRELQQELDIKDQEQKSRNETFGNSIMLGSERVAMRVLHDYLFTAFGEGTWEENSNRNGRLISRHTCRLTVSRYREI